MGRLGHLKTKRVKFSFLATKRWGFIENVIGEICHLSTNWHVRPAKDTIGTDALTLVVRGKGLEFIAAVGN
jgi:hypothetical protein